ncbi:TRAP transporter substrate-binding protein [Diaphorobacter caeni]|uniref:TRAP transporter substrate-binding protein n=1 Tax=Diaphorobacter caeni TaxID=2784387 RepID=UPI00188E327B|nr:TRAP transporter substrate-binding protein [Diaphorobacter caeni]MBF5007118.1 TRAP transporter substrate-binding protein [Diaphorobacter caeni]
MSISRRDLLKATSAVGLAGFAGSAARAQAGTFNYKVATNVPVTHPIYIRLTEATEKIKAETGGKVNIRVFPNGQLGSDTDMLSQVRSGGIEFLTVPGVVLANLVPMASLNSVGFAFADYPAVWKAMDGDLGKYIRAHIAKVNLVVFDKVWDNGFRHITSYKTVNAPADLASLKIRVPQSPLLVSLFKSLKAAPTPINFNELYSSLQTKVVEAQENPLPLISTAKLYEVQKSCALTSHVWDGYWLVSNKRAFEAIPSPMREIVSKHFEAAALAQRADSEKLAVSLQDELAGKGMVFNKPDPAPFRAALQEAKFYAEWKSKFGAEAWAQLESAVGKLA